MFIVNDTTFAQDPIGVTLGGTLGHALCTAMAVIGGKIIAQRISVKTGELNILFIQSKCTIFIDSVIAVTIVGGVVFLIFALTAFLHKSTETD